MTNKKTKVTLLHLDLGIGGAERLMVDLALALSASELYEVKILTSHHDLTHCFEETKQQGELYPFIEVHGDWLPRTLFGGKFTALCGMMRMVYLSAIALLQSKGLMSGQAADLYLLDGISLSIPILRWTGSKVLFYCHFPDKLLCVERASALKKMYRAVLDLSEELTTGAADGILVNSQFTAKIFKSAFPILGRVCSPNVLYPTSIKPSSDSSDETVGDELEYTKGYDVVFVSVNRYERKKNILLAIDALKQLQLMLLINYTKPSSSQIERKNSENIISDDDEFVMVGDNDITVDDKDKAKAVPSIPPTTDDDTTDKPKPVRILLVIAGGFDQRVQENKEYLEELEDHARKLGIVHYLNSESAHGMGDGSGSGSGSVEVAIEFRTSISLTEKQSLMRTATGLLYTPSNEHFGIVPIEAMSVGCPVIAVNSGGPLETIIHEVTGFLCEQKAIDFALSMKTLIDNPSLRDDMGKQGKLRVEAKFSSATFSSRLNEFIQELVNPSKKNSELTGNMISYHNGQMFSVLIWSIVFAMLSILIKCYNFTKK